MIRRFLRKPLAVVSAGWIVLLIVLSILAPWIAPHPPDFQDIANALQGPSPQHWLGTGELGLDVLSRLLYGGRITLLSTAISVGVYALVGVPLGLLAGYRGGFVDRTVLRVSEIAYAVPGAVIVLVVLAVRPGDETAAMIAMGLLAAPSLARIVRSATVNVREELYIRAATVSGLRDSVILRAHVLPVVLSTVIVNVALFATAAIGLETGLGFLGVGTRQVTWGQMVAEASRNIGIQPWLLVPSGFVIVSFILALGLIGDGLRDAAAEGHAAVSTRARRRRAVDPDETATAALSQDAAQEQPHPAATRDIETTVDDPLLSLHDLTVAFASDGVSRDVVSHVSLSVARGEKVGIVGESGSGKTVTATALLGLLPGSGRVVTGELVVDGEAYDLREPDSLAGLRGRRIGMIGQNPISGLDPAFTVRSQLSEVVRANTTLRGKDVERRVHALLEEVRLPDPVGVARDYPHQLSGGMAQRVGIAAALAGEPDLILADEPTTALDVTVQAEILDVLRDLDAAVVLVTHDWGVLADLCTRAIVMYAGQVVEEGPIERIVSAPRHPYTAGLLRSNPHFARPGEPLPAIPGSVLAPEDWPIGCRFADRCPLAEAACRAAPVALVARDDGQGATRCLRQAEVGAPDALLVREGRDA